MGDNSDGSSGGENEDNWYDGYFSTLWDWLSSIISRLNAIGQNISNGFIELKNQVSQDFIEVYTLLFDKFQEMKESTTDFYLDLFDKFQEMKENDISLVDLILMKLDELFTPNTEEIANSFMDFVTELEEDFNVDTDFMTSLFNAETPIEDVSVKINLDNKYMHLGTLNVKIFDTKYFIDVVNYFRPFVRGFIVLMLMLFHVKQFIGFFGYDAGVITGRTDAIADNKEFQRGHFKGGKE